MATADKAAQYQAAQEGLIHLLKADIRAAWTILRPGEMAKTLPALITRLQSFTDLYGSSAAQLAADFYTAERDAADVTGYHDPEVAPVTAPEIVEGGVRRATLGLWTPDADEQALEAAQTLTEGAMVSDTLSPARDTIITNVKSDLYAKGWARELESARPCAFCAMLATRGAVYHVESGANFQAHDNCQCVAVPVFTAYEPPARVRDFEALYKESTQGTSGKNSLKAFRRAYDAKYPA